MPAWSRAAVALPVWDGSMPVATGEYDGALATFSSRKATPRTATAETAAMPLLRAGRRRKLWTKDGISQWPLDLCVEDVLGGLDRLRTNLACHLHGQLGPLDGHDDRGRVAGLAGGECLRGGRRLVLRVRQRLQRLAEHGAEPAARRLRRRGGLDRADLPVGPGDGEGGVDRGHLRRSSVLAIICLVDCMAVTLAS